MYTRTQMHGGAHTNRKSTLRKCLYVPAANRCPTPRLGRRHVHTFLPVPLSSAVEALGSVCRVDAVLSLCTGERTLVWPVSWPVRGKLGHSEPLPERTSYFPYLSAPSHPSHLLVQFCSLHTSSVSGVIFKVFHINLL